MAKGKLPTPIIIGQPLDDPDCDLMGYFYPPDEFTFPPPWPGIVGCVAALFSHGSVGSLDTIMKDFQAIGWYGMSMTIRLEEQIPGQTTDGKYPQQTDDLRLGIQYMRALDNCVGFVETIGGSGSAHHAVYTAVTGTIGDDRADAAVGLSTPTDFSDRDSDVNQNFIKGVTTYGRTTDLPTLLSISPAGLVTSTASPIYFSNGTDENMPYSCLTRFITALDTAGVTNYKAVTNADNKHSFTSWSENKAAALLFSQQAFVNWSGGGPIPSPLAQGFRLALDGGPYTITGAQIGGILPETARSAEIIDLAPETTYTATLIHFSGSTESDPAVTEFTTGPVQDRKPIPFGAYHLLSAPDGDFWTDLDTAETLPFTYVKGYRGRTGFDNVINGALGVYDFSGPDSGITIISNNNKKLGMNISIGFNATDLWYDTGGPDEVAKIAIDLADITPQAYQPVPWDPKHLEKAQTFIADLGAKYDSNPTISYFVVSGFMQNTEFHLSKTAADDIQFDDAATAFGYANKVEAIVFAAQTIIQYYIDAFPNTPLYFTTAKCYFGADGNTARNEIENWVKENTEHKCGVMVAFARATEAPHDPPIASDYPKGCQAVSSSNDHDRFYDVEPVPYPTPPTLVDDFMLTNAAIGRTFHELYTVDIADPLNATVITENNLILQSIVPVL